MGFLGSRMVTMDMSVSLVPVASAKKVREHHHEVRLTMINSMYNMSTFNTPPGVQDADLEPVHVRGTGVVGHGGP